MREAGLARFAHIVFADRSLLEKRRAMRLSAERASMLQAGFATSGEKPDHGDPGRRRVCRNRLFKVDGGEGESLTRYWCAPSSAHHWRAVHHHLCCPAYWRVTRGADRRHSSPYKAELYRQRGRLLRPNNGWCQPPVPGCRPRQGHEGRSHSPASSLFGDPLSNQHRRQTLRPIESGEPPMRFAFARNDVALR